jgi:chromosome segregation protein
LGDVIAEIEKQVITLRRQAKRARRYAEKKDILKNIEIKMAGATLFNSDEKYKTLSDTKRQLQIDVEAQASGLDSAELKYQELRLELSEKEHEASNKRQTESELSLRAAESESEIKLNKQKSDAAVIAIGESRSTIEDLKKRIESVTAEVEAKKSELTNVDKQSSEYKKESDTLEQQLANKTEELTSKESEYENKRLSHSQIAEKISSIKGEVSSIESLISNMRTKSENAVKNAEGLSSYKSDNVSDISNLEDNFNKINERIKALSDDQQKRENEIAALISEISQIKEKQSNYKADYSGLTARRELFEQMIETGEGYSGGAKSLMAWPDKPDGMMLPLAEVLEVPEQYRVAISSVLGEMGELIPVENYTVAETAIDYLKNNGGGRAKFIPLNKIRNYDTVKPNSASGFVGYAEDVFTYPDEYKQIVKLLLGGLGSSYQSYA